MYESLLKKIGNHLLLTVEGEGDGTLLGGGKGSEEHVVPENYTFEKLKSKDDKGADVEADVDADTSKAVAEYAKAHKLSQAQAQAHMNQTLEFSNKLKAATVNVPETYTFAKIKSKDEKGNDVEVDVAKEISDPIAAFAKENKLMQETAQKLLDREIASVEAATADYQKQTDEMVKGWREEARKDPVLGAGDFNANLASAKKALDTFFPGLAKNVNDHMFLDHPMILRGLYDIGKKIGEDSEFVKGKGSEQNVAPEKKMFPTMNKK